MSVSPLGRHRRALYVLFLVQGIAMASWITRTPAIRDSVDASTAVMGLILLGMSAGAMISVLSAGFLVARFGTKAVAVTGTWSIVLGVPVVGAGSAVHSALMAGVGLFLTGLGIGSVEVALNVDGAAVEKESGKPVLTALHGFFSLGTVLGAGAGFVSTSNQVPVGWHLLGAGVVVLGALLYVARFIPGGTGQRDGRSSADRAAQETTCDVLKDPRLLAIGVIVLAMALAEGTANDWLPLILFDEHGFGEGWGSASFAIFAAAMTVGRFAGTRVLKVFSEATVLRVSAVFGAVGLLAIISLTGLVFVLPAIVLWGLGASLGFPIALSVAGISGHDGAVRVSVAATIGYVAFLAGPPIIGIIGEHFGLRSALVLPLALVVLAFFMAPSVRPRPPYVASLRDDESAVEQRSR